MQIDDKLIAYLEDLSSLSLSGDQKSRIAVDLKELLDYMQRLCELDTEGIAECSHPFDDVNVYREDEAGPSPDRALILQNAPVKNDRFIIAPKVFD